MFCLRASFFRILVQTVCWNWQRAARRVLYKIVNTWTFDIWKTSLPRGLTSLSYGPLSGLAVIDDTVAVKSYGKFEKRH